MGRPRAAASSSGLVLHHLVLLSFLCFAAVSWNGTNQVMTSQSLVNVSSVLTVAANQTLDAGKHHVGSSWLHDTVL